MDSKSKHAAWELVELLLELEELHRLGIDCPPERRQAYLNRKEELLARIEHEGAVQKAG